VSEEDRAALLGHALRTMPEHYAGADIGTDLLIDWSAKGDESWHWHCTIALTRRD
jgi:hypothetical protein